eukprot:gene1201-1357_t
MSMFHRDSSMSTSRESLTSGTLRDGDDDVPGGQSEAAQGDCSPSSSVGIDVVPTEALGSGTPDPMPSLIPSTRESKVSDYTVRKHSNTIYRPRSRGGRTRGAVLAAPKPNSGPGDASPSTPLLVVGSSECSSDVGGTSGPTEGPVPDPSDASGAEDPTGEFAGTGFGFAEFVRLKKENRLLKLQIAQLRTVEGNRKSHRVDHGREKAMMGGRMTRLELENGGNGEGPVPVPSLERRLRVRTFNSRSVRRSILGTGEGFIRFQYGDRIVRTSRGEAGHVNYEPLRSNLLYFMEIPVANQFYGLLFVLVGILFVPIALLREPPPDAIPPMSISTFLSEVWDTLETRTTLHLILFVLGVHTLAHVHNKATYNVIELTNFQSGIDVMSSYLALVIALSIFQAYLMNSNWQRTSYLSCLFSLLLFFLWIPVFYNSGGLRNGWFTIFIDLDQAFTGGLAQVLFSLAVVELAKPGLESTTFELLISVANASQTLSNVLFTQLLNVFHATGCKKGNCDNKKSVDLKSVRSYQHSGGPRRFTYYTLLC